MTAKEIQHRFLGELGQNGIDRLDLAIARGPERRFQLRGLQNLGIEEIYRRLPWLRHENHEGSDIYFRPEKGGPWPIIFLDDLTSDQAVKMVKSYRCWSIETSPGRFHTWIITDRPLSPPERYAEQKIFITQGIGDPGSVSGDHFGRFPGFKSWKRGSWVNLMSSPNQANQLFHPMIGRQDQGASSIQGLPSGFKRVESKRDEIDTSESGKEFGWACNWLRAGLDPEKAIRKLTMRATYRGKNRPEDYARRTVSKAQEIVLTEKVLGPTPLG